MPMYNEDHVTLAVLAIGYILFSPLTPATHFPRFRVFLFTPGFDWFISLTTRNVVPENIDVAIPIGARLLVPEPEGVSYGEFFKKS